MSMPQPCIPVQKLFKIQFLLNAWQNHIMLVTNKDKFCKKCTCLTCTQMSHRLDKCETHVKTCWEGERMLVFPGKYYRDIKSIYDKLAEYEITTNDPYFD